MVPLHFDADQVLELFQRVPYFKVMSPAGAQRYLTKLMSDGNELTNMLRLFPAVLYEPLDDHYACLVCQGAATKELIADLCNPILGIGWRGILGASWLVALSPDPAFKDILVNAKSRAPKNGWLVELAIDEVDNVSNESYPEIQSLIRQLRATLVELPRPVRALQPANSGDYSQTVQAAVKAAYRVGGSEAAVAKIKSFETSFARGLTYVLSNQR